MIDWSAGYVVDLDYTYGCYPELNPQRMQMAFLDAGFAFPEVRTACELGFGQGMGINVHAAKPSVSWWGTDFNPAQAAFAQEAAAASKTDVKIFDETFAEFCARADLPEFDFIGLHGIWSWISDENRTVIVDFLRRKLKVGGVLYISYNTMPGWASMAPIRHLLSEHAEVMGAPGRGTSARIDAALEFADKFLAVKPAYARAYPQIAERLKGLKGQSRNYLAHEFFNRDWQPMPFAEMARWLSSAKLNFACSAYYLDHVDIVNLSAEQQAFLKDIPDATFRETVRDFMVNQQFRRDYWVKGARKLSVLEQAEALRTQRLMLTRERSEVVLKADGAAGEAALHEAVYDPILDALADHQPKSLRQVEHAMREKNINFGKLLQAVILLLGNGVLQPVQDESVTRRARPGAERLNAYFMNKARSSPDFTTLASPVTGGGMGVQRVDQLFLLARTGGKKQPQEWVQFCWDVLNRQGHRILKDGNRLESPEENLNELTRQANEFVEKRLPILKALEIG